MIVADKPEHHPVFPVNTTGADAIQSAFALVVSASVVAHDDNRSSAEALNCIKEVLDLAESFLEAGAAWARDVENAIIAVEREDSR